MVERLELRAQHAASGGGEAIGLAAIVGLERFDQAIALESRDRAIQRAGTKTAARHRFDIVQHGVSVFWSVGKARQNEQRGIGIAAGILTTSWHVVMLTECRPGVARAYLKED